MLKGVSLRWSVLLSAADLEDWLWSHTQRAVIFCLKKKASQTQLQSWDASLKR